MVKVRSSDTVGAEVYTEMLLKNTTPYITTQVSAHQAKRRIAESTNTPIEFLAKYDELKAKNVRDLDPLVFLLSKLSEDEQLPAPGTKMSAQELAEVKDMLLKEAQSVPATTSSEILRKALREKQLKRNVNIPHQPEWLFKRPSLTLDFIVGVDEPTDQGIEGKYILARALTERYAPKEFMIDQSLEKSAFEYGLVNHALSAAMRTLIKDYMVLVAQLEHQFRTGNLTLQKLWFYIQPTIRTLEILSNISNSINRSCVPYFEILEKWIYKGIISDPYSEFLVEENEKIQKEKLQEDYNDAYWEQHYTICRERIPVFLEQVANKILNTGKYLNVVRLSGRDVKCPSAEEIVYTLKERKYYEQIEKAYNYASKLLLDMLIDEKKLMARIRSIKYYFLLDKGDFIVQFMDMTEEEMKQDIENIMPTRLETLLELALRTSTANVDTYKDDLRVELLPYDLITQLFKILTIETKMEKDYRVDPTDLAFVWMGNKAAKMYSVQSQKGYSAAFALRQRMLNFVQNFEYYMMFEVVEPNWHIFQSNMESVSNVDDVLAYHTDFLNNCLKDCMLTNPDLLKIVHKIMVVCVTFSNFIQRLSTSTTVEVEEKPTRESSLQATQSGKDKKETTSKIKTSTKVVSEHVDSLVSSENFERSIGKFDSNFSTQLLELLEKIMNFSSISGEFKLFNILYRFNKFLAVIFHKSETRKCSLCTRNTQIFQIGFCAGEYMTIMRYFLFTESGILYMCMFHDACDITYISNKKAGYYHKYIFTFMKFFLDIPNNNFHHFKLEEILFCMRKKTDFTIDCFQANKGFLAIILVSRIVH
ncbi:hypothetical protein KUTeg_006756 [Tegillarca granosa]|uniref:Gamma-tubulin complex component n=1 Tax=Tegillarca granosa TaxID=220873 RepID=A0ABQ9FEG4_TEGGR|nr:hypothetical protein KUTeg_006756 [Tegillarca granosa]